MRERERKKNTKILLIKETLSLTLCSADLVERMKHKKKDGFDYFVFER